MRNIFLVLMLAVGSLYLTGCGSVESETVGVRTSFTGKVNTQEEGQGFYTAVFSNLDKFSCKEITIELDDMTPKAGDNLTMKDMDVEIFYKVACDQNAEQYLKYSNRTAYDSDVGLNYAGYQLVRSLGREATYNAVAKYDSLQVHKNREAIGGAILNETQKQLDADDPGVYTVTKVIIRNATTDPSVEQSIRLAVQKDKELEAVTKQVQILEQQAAANAKLQVSLTPEILTQQYLEVLGKAADGGNLKLVDLGCQGGALLDIPLRDK